MYELKHTFGRRLRAAGVSFENREDLLGDRSGRVATHSSAPEFASLIEAANKGLRCGVPQKIPSLVILKSC